MGSSWKQHLCAGAMILAAAGARAESTSTSGEYAGEERAATPTSDVVSRADAADANGRAPHDDGAGSGEPAKPRTEARAQAAKPAPYEPDEFVRRIWESP